MGLEKVVGHPFLVPARPIATAGVGSLYQIGQGAVVDTSPGSPAGFVPCGQARRLLWFLANVCCRRRAGPGARIDRRNRNVCSYTNGICIAFIRPGEMVMIRSRITAHRGPSREAVDPRPAKAADPRPAELQIRATAPGGAVPPGTGGNRDAVPGVIPGLPATACCLPCRDIRYPGAHGDPLGR